MTFLLMVVAFIIGTIVGSRNYEKVKELENKAETEVENKLK